MAYLVKASRILKLYYPGCTWSGSPENQALYLSFDDGPHPLFTPFILEQLKKYRAKATFFCLGKNVDAHPDLFRQIQSEGHQVGNHTQHHLNGWKTSPAIYLSDIQEASKHIPSRLFRPPYGKISLRQIRLLTRQGVGNNYRIIMWDVLSGDFDLKLQKEKCLDNVLNRAVPGSIIVFHDSEKAWDRMSYALPRVLDHFSKKGYSFAVIPE